MKKAFVFDMDGVLIDTESICDRTWEMAADYYNLDKELCLKSINLCRGTNKAATREIVRNLFPHLNPDEYLAKTSEFFMQIEEGEGINKMPYAFECLDYLRSKGWKLALASSTRGPVVESHLRKTGLLEFFEYRVTGDLVQHSKPDPEIYLKACGLLNLSPDECLAVEDSPNGLKSAKSAGLSTIMIPDRIMPNDETRKVTDYEFKTLKEIIEFF